MLGIKHQYSNLKVPTLDIEIKHSRLIIRKTKVTISDYIIYIFTLKNCI